LEEEEADGFLVPPHAEQVELKFPREGIDYESLKTTNAICISVRRRLRALFAYSIGRHRRGQWRADGNMVGADEKAPVFTGKKWWRRRESNPHHTFL